MCMYIWVFSLVCDMCVCVYLSVYVRVYMYAFAYLNDVYMWKTMIATKYPDRAKLFQNPKILIHTVYLSVYICECMCREMHR